MSNKERIVVHQQEKEEEEEEEENINNKDAANAGDMDDEYGNMDDKGETYVFQGKFALESGKYLLNPEVRFNTYGNLDKERRNVMVVCHALTGNSALHTWWSGLLGPGLLFDTDKYFVVCANMLGSCYGTCGPRSINPENGHVYGSSFPDVSVRDSVRLHINLLKNHLKVNHIVCVVGGSLGGMQTLEWALETEPTFIDSLIVLCCGAYHHAWQIGISETQRQAIYADPKWKNGDYPTDDPPKSGLSVARQIAMVTYRSHAAYNIKFSRKIIRDSSAGHGQSVYFDVEQYLRYQGIKFTKRFDPLSYVKVTRMMDSHDIGRGRGGWEKALGSIKQPTLVVSVSSDILYPPVEQEKIAQYIKNSEHFIAISGSGHDGFLLDQDQIMPVALTFLKKHLQSNSNTAKL